MTLRNSDLQSDSDLDSIRNSCDVLISTPLFCACVFEYLLLNVCLILYLNLRMTNKGESWTQQLIWLVGAWSLKQAAELETNSQIHNQWGKNINSQSWNQIRKFTNSAVGKKIHNSWKHCRELNDNLTRLGQSCFQHQCHGHLLLIVEAKVCCCSLKQPAIPIGRYCFFTSEHKVKVFAWAWGNKTTYSYCIILLISQSRCFVNLRSRIDLPF